MSDIETKSLIGTATGLFLYVSNQFNALAIVLSIFIIIDYLLGVTSAIKDKKWDKDVGFWGAITKLCYGITVLVGWLVDYSIKFLADRVNTTVDIPAVFGIGIIIYLLGNEGLSISKHLTYIGSPVPPFLLKVFGYFKDEAGNIVKIPDIKPKKPRRDV